MSFDLILPFFRPIEHLLLSDTVSEIMVNPDSSVWIEEDGEKVHLHRLQTIVTALTQVVEKQDDAPPPSGRGKAASGRSWWLSLAGRGITT